MLNRLIGKNVEITVAFAESMHSTGSGPVCYYGILQEVDQEYCVLSLSFKRPAVKIINDILNVGSGLGENCSGNIYIRKEYIVTCLELQQ